MIFIAIVVIILCILLLGIIYANTNFKRLPPSPFKLWFIGNLGQAIKYKLPLHELFASYNDPIMTFWLGSLPLVVVNDYDIAKKIAHMKECSSRPQRYAGDVVSRGFKGLVLAEYSDELHKRRRLGTKLFHWHDKSHLEGLLRDQSTVLIDTIKQKIDQGKSNIIEIDSDIKLAMCNTIWGLLFNRKINLSQGEFTEVNEMLTCITKGLTCANLLEGFPFLKRFKFKNLDYLFKFCDHRDKIIGPEYQRHLNFCHGNEKKDLTDMFMSENFTKDEIEMMLADFVIAGFETTASAINFCIIYLLNNPKVKEKCIEEIETVLEKRKVPNLDDVDQMHYVKAVVSETLRLKPISPTAVPHRADENVFIKNVMIPKHTAIFFNIYNFHKDPKYHKDPNEFRPERFLSEKNTYRSIDGYMPFSSGKRECIGKRFAMKEIIFFLTVLLTSFSLESPENVTADETAIPSVVLTPKTYQVKVTEKQ